MMPRSHPLDNAIIHNQKQKEPQTSSFCAFSRVTSPFYHQTRRLCWPVIRSTDVFDLAIPPVSWTPIGLAASAV